MATKSCPECDQQVRSTSLIFRGVLLIAFRFIDTNHGSLRQFPALETETGFSASPGDHDVSQRAQLVDADFLSVSMSVLTVMAL